MAKLRKEKKAETEAKEEKARRRSAPRLYKIKVGDKYRIVKMYKIGGLGRWLGRETKTLHMWEREGILPKAMFRDSANRRMYTEDQVHALTEAFTKVIHNAKKYKWVTELRAAFHEVWKQLPRGVKEDE